MLHSQIFSLVGHVLRSHCKSLLRGSGRNNLVCDGFSMHDLSSKAWQFDCVLEKLIGIVIIRVLVGMVDDLIKKVIILRLTPLLEIGIIQTHNIFIGNKITFTFYLQRSKSLD